MRVKACCSPARHYDRSAAFYLRRDAEQNDKVAGAYAAGRRSAVSEERGFTLRLGKRRSLSGRRLAGYKCVGVNLIAVTRRETV